LSRAGRRPIHLRENLGASPGLAAAGFAAFSLAMACVRFAADALSARYGPVTVVRVGAVAAVAGLALAVLGRSAATGVAGFAVLGAGLAPVVPTAYSAAGNTSVGPSRSALGGAVTAGNLGSIVGPLAIGFTADVVGLRTALWTPAVLAFVIVVGAGSFAAAHGPTPSG
jgi:MFS family permease